MGIEARRQQLYEHTSRDHESYKKHSRIRSHRWRKPVTHGSSHLVCLCGDDVYTQKGKVQALNPGPHTQGRQSTTESVRVERLVIYQSQVQAQPNFKLQRNLLSLISHLSAFYRTIKRDQHTSLKSSRQHIIPHRHNLRKGYLNGDRSK